ISLDDQNVNFTALLRVDGHKVRLRIRSNPYSFQCHAVAEIWHSGDLRWNGIASIGHGSMKTPTSLYVLTSHGMRRPIYSDPSHWRDDATELLRLVAAVLL